MEPTVQRRIDNAWASLDALSVGDAFGEGFFDSPERIAHMLGTRTIPDAPWPYTDDTVMAMSIVDVLAENGTIDADVLSRLFAARFVADPYRGYGGTALHILARISRGDDWRAVAAKAFDGAGSMGNGGAMRAAPIGAYFFDDVGRAAAEARRSAEVTHAHPEGQAGAMAVAVAAAWVTAGGERAEDLFACVLAHTPDGATREGIASASQLPLSCDVRTAVAALGNGSRVISPDTVPFCIWSAARHLGDFEAAMWETVSGGGDRDTTCAIVAGILALHASLEIPAHWREAREPLERMARGAFEERPIVR